MERLRDDSRRLSRRERVFGVGAVDVHDRVSGYVCDVLGSSSSSRITSVVRLDAGARHVVFRVTCRDAIAGANDLVVRVSTRDGAAERAQAERETTVLEKLRGVGAPLLYDFSGTSRWFEAPAMCLQFVDGRQGHVVGSPGEAERLGSVVAVIHELPTDDLVDFPAARTMEAYVDERLEKSASYLRRLRDRLPASVRSRVVRAFSSVTASMERARIAESFRADDSFALLHGDVSAGNIVWAERPVLIDWEYARMGDPAEEIAYIFGEHRLAAPQRRAFWSGYRGKDERLDLVVERVRWWEPVTLLRSALVWLEQWSRRADADTAGEADPSTPRPQSYYLDHAIRRLDRFDRVTAAAGDGL